jgi:catechol 2,3-dioxygenase-like lactoylglutathione lyase family enzyme
MTSSIASSIDSILLASAHPERLRKWYVEAFDVQPDADGFLPLGSVGVLIDGRDDVDPTTAEPGRVILNHHVPDIHAAAKRLDEMHAPWVAPVAYRDAGLWFGTVEDPDGNYVQLIQTTPDYWVQKRKRAGASTGPLTGAALAVRLPAQDLDRARGFYSEILGLDPIDERPGGLLYTCGGQEFVVFASTGRASGEHTQMGFTVPNLDDAVAQLRARGLEFELFEFGDLQVTDGIVTIPGYYSTKPPTGERAIWFRDSEGNLLGLGEHTFD